MTRPSRAISQVRHPQDWVGWRLTGPGKVVLLIVIVLLALGITRNINLLTLLGYLLASLLVLNFAAGGRRLRRLRGQRFLDPHYYAGSSGRIEVRFTNPGGHAVESVHLEDLGPQHHLRWYLSRFASRDRHVMDATLQLPTRGWYDFAALAASSGYPFGLVSCRYHIGPAVRILVLPRTGLILRERFRSFLRGRDPRADRSVHRALFHESAQAEIHGLRDYRPGDCPRWIHWRTSARRGQLMVREFEDVPGDDLFLLLVPPPETEDLEAAVEVAATLVKEWCQRRGDRLTLGLLQDRFLVYDGLSSPEHGEELHRHLALVQALNSSEPVHLAGLETQVPATASVVVLSADATLAERVERLLHRPVADLDIRQRRDWNFYLPPADRPNSSARGESP